MHAGVEPGERPSVTDAVRRGQLDRAHRAAVPRLVVPVDEETRRPGHDAVEHALVIEQRQERRPRGGDEISAIGFDLGGQTDPVAQAERPGDLLGEERSHRDPRDAPDDLAGDPPVGAGVIAVGTARLPTVAPVPRWL